MEICHGLNMKATELRLGLPGRESPEREEEAFDHLRRGLVEEKNDNMLGLLKKRGFSDAINGASAAKWGLSVGCRYEKDKADAIVLQPSPASVKEKNSVNGGGGTADGGCHGFSPSSKAQVVGWPPIRSFRKNAMTTHSSKPKEDAEVKSGLACLYVKVSMDGAPYLRKIDLKNLLCYIELSSALEKMFSCFTIGQCDGFSESRVMDLLHGSEYVLTYEDRDGDWMLVGDVPWDMFIESCRRLRIMLSSEAIGLAPRAFEKCRSRN